MEEIKSFIRGVNEITLPLVCGNYILNKLDVRIKAEEVIVFVERMYYDMCLKVLMENKYFNKKEGSLGGVKVLLREKEDFESKTNIKILNTRKVCDSEYYHVLNVKQYLLASEYTEDLRLFDYEKEVLNEYVSSMKQKVENYKFLPVVKGEEKIVKKIYREVIKTTLTTWDEEYPSYEMIEQDVINNELFCLKDEQNNIVGVCFVSNKFEGEEEWKYELKNPFRFARICSLPHLQGFGIATKMLKELIAYVKGLGCDGLRISVYNKNASALKLYDNFGFEKVGECFKYGFDFYLYELRF